MRLDRLPWSRWHLLVGVALGTTWLLDLKFRELYIFRALTGAGIGGEYAAVNSAVDELITGRMRGQIDLMINSTFWIGAALGSGVSLILLNAGFFPPRVGWRFAFGLGAAIGVVILFMRRWIPESPRWLLTHGKESEASGIVDDVERQVSGGHPESLPKTDAP